MNVKQTAKRQYARIIDNAARRFEDHSQPKEGWITTMRKALGMSGPQLAKRADLTKAAIYQAERKELAGEITIKQMVKLASHLNGKFVYAIIPDDEHIDLDSDATIDGLLKAQALLKANAIVGRSSDHMALELQSLSRNLNEDAVSELADRLKREQASDFWNKT